MTADSTHQALREIRALYVLGPAGGMTDAQLVARFIDRGDGAEAAFAALVERHGPMVLGVCRRMLGGDGAGEAGDAFQAVFLVLARRAGAIRRRDGLKAWLYGIAVRTAKEARRRSARRRASEGMAMDRARSRSAPDEPHSEWLALLDEELSRLPERFRLPLVLCELEGTSRKDAAQRLNLPEGTLSSRLARGRALLRDRLARRGLGPAALALMFPAPPAMPGALMATTTTLATGLSRNGSVAVPAVALMKGVLLMEWIRKLQAAAVVILLGSVASVAVLAAHRGKADEPPAKAAAPATKPAARPIRDVLRDAAKAAAPDGDVKAAAYILLAIARAQVHVGDREGALETARRLSEAAEDLGPGAAEILIALAYVRDAAGDRAGGLKELVRADRFPDDQTGAIQTPTGPNTKTWFPARRLIAEAWYDLGDVEGAKAIVQVMAVGVASLRPGNRIIAAQELATAQVKIGDIDGAFHTVAQVGSNKRHVLGAIADATSSATHWQLQPRRELTPEEREARRPILKRVEEVTEGFQFDDDKCYSDLAVAWARLWDFDSALRVAHRMGKGPMRFPNSTDRSGIVYVLSVIGGMQAKAGRKEEAAATIREALDLVERNPEFSHRRSQIAGVQFGAGDAAGAFKMMESASAEERRRWLTGIAGLQAKAGDRAAARATLLRALNEAEQLLEAPAPPPTPIEEERRRHFPSQFPVDRDLAHKDAIRSEIAEIHARLGHFDAASTFLRQITPGASQGRHCAQSITKARAEDGDVEGAFGWALSLDPALRVEALRGLAAGVTGR